MEGTPMKLEAGKGSKQRSQEQCKARTKAGGPCQAPAIEGGLCFCHAYPEKMAELGKQGGQKNRRWRLHEGDLPYRSLKSISQVSELSEETINRLRQGPFDLRAANAIGFLAGILLKAIDCGRIEDRFGSHWRQSWPAAEEPRPKRLTSSRRRNHRMKSRQRRLKAIELTQTPQQVVVMWRREALQAGTIEEGARHSHYIAVSLRRCECGASHREREHEGST